MLLVSRFKNQSIMIGENIEVKVARIEGKSVCLGIIAPKNITIHKKEFINHLKSIFKKEK